MINENAKLLVAALRSGEYKQTWGRLCIVRNDDPYRDTRPVGFCCLGVACEVAIKAGLPVVKTAATDFGLFRTAAYDDTLSVLPPSVQKWLGFASEGGEHYGPAGRQSLAFLNDYKHLTFAQIADIIESEPKGLFTNQQ